MIRSCIASYADGARRLDAKSRVLCALFFGRYFSVTRSYGTRRAAEQVLQLSSMRFTHDSIGFTLSSLLSLSHPLSVPSISRSLSYTRCYLSKCRTVCAGTIFFSHFSHIVCAACRYCHCLAIVDYYFFRTLDAHTHTHFHSLSLERHIKISLSPFSFSHFSLSLSVSLAPSDTFAVVL